MASKVFEVGDVLPATTQLKIYSTNVGLDQIGGIGRIKTDLDSFTLVDYEVELLSQMELFYINGVGCYNNWNPPYIIIDTSNWSLSKRTVSTTSGIFNNPGQDHALYWEDLNAPSGFNVTYEENGGTSVTDLTEQTALPSPLPTTAKANHVFAGWYYDSSFTQKANAGDELTANVTLYAKWYTPTTWCEDIADAIREKEGSSGSIKHVDFPARINALTLESGSGDTPSTGSQNIFTGATIPLTYKNNTHEYENNYEYKSATHNITITGLDGRATITGNGTKNVLVAFDVTSATSSLKNFTITCVNGEQTLEYKGLHAHYGTTVEGILTFAYNNITYDGSEGTIGTNYKFISTSSTDLPLFTSNTTLWNAIYSYQVLNVLMGNYSSSSIGDYFLNSCYSFNQPLTLPSNLSSIGNEFLRDCYSFNQPLTLPSNLSSIGFNFLRSCYSFNQPLTLPSNLSSTGDYFLNSCYSFNQPLTLPSNLSSIGINFLNSCYSFNQPLTLPSNLSSIGSIFLNSCYSFNQPLTLPSNLSSIGDNFLSYCRAFNQPLTLPSNLSSIGSDFLRDCYSLSVIVYNASVYPTGNGSLSQSINSKTSSSGAGIIVYGTKRAELMSALANRTSSPYRKLINGGS